MPGSTAASSSEQSKAKVTDPSATNGIFVRPVAVAGIFRPAEESANKPPALPEKRRFSALVGDLRPSSTGSADLADDFNRRRQSWDTKAKEVPFGQVLLRKTPRNTTNASSLPVKQEVSTNGSSHEDISRNVKSSLPCEGKDADNSKSDSSTSVNSSTSNLFAVPKDKSSSNDVLNKKTTEIVTQTGRDVKSVNQSNFYNQNHSSNETVSIAEVKTTAEFSSSSRSKLANASENSSNKANASKNSTNKTQSQENVVDTQFTDNSKQPKKVYGLMKRDSKVEATNNTENYSVKLESQINSSKIESSLPKKETSVNLSTKSEILTEKTLVNNSDSKSKVKVYGLSKKAVAKDVKDKETDVNKQSAANTANVQPATSVASKSSENTAFEKTVETRVVYKQPEVLKKSDSSKNKTVELNAVKATETNSVVSETPKSSISKTVETSKITKVTEFQKSQSPPKDFRTVRRTSDVIAARIQNIFSNISSPEKPPSLATKKSKLADKTGANADTSSTKSTVINATSEKLNSVQITKINDENQVVNSNKTESKVAIENKPYIVELKNSSNAQSKAPSVEKQEVKANNKRSDGETEKEECKYKTPAHPSADHSVLKKENKSAADSSNVKQSCKIGEVSTTCGVKTEPTLEKADSKTECSINAVASKAQGKKIINIGGKMPIKKEDRNSLDGTTSLKATNQDDRKSLDLTSPSKTIIESINKGSVLKTEISNTVVGSGEKIVKNISTSSCSLDTSVNTSNDLKNIKTSENSVSVKESKTSQSSFVSQTTVKTSSYSNEISQSRISKAEKTVVNGSIESPQVSKIEVAKIAPSTVPGIVPTVNVLFRTKSPQSAANKEENRKKVVVETYAISSSVPSDVINASKVSKNISVQATSNATETAKEALKSVEKVQKPLDSPRVPKKHSIVNLKKEELVSVTLAAGESCDVGTKMSPSSLKIENKCSVGDKIEVPSPIAEKSKIPEGIVTTVDKYNSSLESVRRVDSPISRTAGVNDNTGAKPKLREKVSEPDFVPKHNIEMGEKSISTKSSVLDLSDWNKKFQRIEPEPPRVPVRRRAGRESMSPSFTMRSQFGSLKRIDDSPRYIPRSPSQSSLPQRYSYTEMLSKVSSMGVLPYTEPSSISKSCSSSSSQVSELWSELTEEQATATHTSEMLESETTERMRLEKEMQDLQNRCSQVQLRSDKMEMEMMEARVYRTPELNGDLSEDEDPEGNSSLYKQKYERAVRDMEVMKRRIQQQHEEEMEQKAMLKKASDKRLAEALEDVEEERQVANQWKRKAQKLGSELQDLRLMLEEQMARNGELEKKQRRFDAELSAAQEEIKKERMLREKFTREKEQALHEKYSLEQDLQSSKLDNDTLHEKITQLNRELDELTLSSKGEEEVTQLKRAKQELERKNRDQEEELEELAAQVGMLEQAKLRLEMSLEKVRQEHRREASVREEEIEEIRASFSKKIKNLEAQLEAEQDERHQLVKQKHELERRLYEIADQPPPHDPEIERRLRRDLKRTKALLRDAQSMLEHTREGQSGKTLIRQLKNQLEDSEFAKAAAVKARQAVEAELQECQTQLEEAMKAKNDAESRCLQLSREKSAIHTQLEEAEEEMAEVMKKYKAVVAQMSIDQKALSEQNQQIADLETEKQMLKDQLSEVSHKFEHLATQSEDTHKVHRLDGKVRDLESKLELEQTTRSRLEHQIARLKEQNDRAREECDALRNKELQAQEGVRRLQRQVRDLREDYSSLQQKEAEAYRKQHELEMALENNETDLQVTKNDLRLACQRIQDLQNALEDDLDSGTDVPDDSGSDSDESFELAMLRNSSVTPTQRCDSAASNYSYASAEGIRSRTSSFTQELSAFSSRNDVEKDFNGFSGVNSSSRLLDVELDETV